MEFLLGLKRQFFKKSGPPDRIPAFSTITLSCIERPRRLNSTTIGTDLKVLSALAKILVRDHEVAAVVASKEMWSLILSLEDSNN